MPNPSPKVKIKRRSKKNNGYVYPLVPVGETYYQLNYDWEKNPYTHGNEMVQWFYDRNAILQNESQRYDFDYTPSGLVPKVPGYTLTPVGWQKQ